MRQLIRLLLLCAAFALCANATVTVMVHGVSVHVGDAVTLNTTGATAYGVFCSGDSGISAGNCPAFTDSVNNFSSYTRLTCYATSSSSSCGTNYGAQWFIICGPTTDAAEVFTPGTNTRLFVYALQGTASSSCNTVDIGNITSSPQPTALGAFTPVEGGDLLLIGLGTNTNDGQRCMKSVNSTCSSDATFATLDNCISASGPCSAAAPVSSASGQVWDYSFPDGSAITSYTTIQQTFSNGLAGTIFKVAPVGAAGGRHGKVF